jgi:hypothetical protein
LEGFALTIGADRKSLSGNGESARTIGATRSLAELHARYEHRQILHVAAIQRQFNYALIFNDSTDSCVLSIQKYSACCNLNRFRHIADLKSEVLPDICCRLDTNIRHYFGLEAFHFDFYVVVPYGN